MRTLRRIKRLVATVDVQMPRRALRRRFDLTDVSMEPEAGPAPEAVFDRITGPYGRAFAQLGAFDEET